MIFDFNSYCVKFISLEITIPAFLSGEMFLGFSRVKIMVLNLLSFEFLPVQ